MVEIQVDFDFWWIFTFEGANLLSYRAGQRKSSITRAILIKIKWESKRLETRQIALYHIQNSGLKELNRIYGVISKIG